MGRGKHYNLKYNNKIIKKLVSDGFKCKISCKNGNKFYVYRDDGPKYLIHSGGCEKSYSLKKFLKINYDYNFI